MTNSRTIFEALVVSVVAGVLTWMAVAGAGDEETSARVVSLGAGGRAVGASSFFVRPFLTDFGATGVSFDGGKLPVFDHRLPRTQFGDSIGKSRLQIAMLVDWTKPECRQTYQLIHALYAAADSKGLPGIDLFLLPVYGDAIGKSVHESVMAVHFGSNRVETFPAILAGLGSGALPAESEAIRELVVELDPDLASRWKYLEANQQDRVNRAFGHASAQVRHNKARLGEGGNPQLIAFDSVLIGQPVRESLSEFLVAAAERQHAYLTSPEGAAPLVIDRSCDCKDPNHQHDLPESPLGR